MKHIKKLCLTVMFAVCAVVVLSGSAFAVSGTSMVLAETMDLRADMDYSSALLATAKYGDSVVVESDAGYGWYRVSFNGKTGYMSSVWLSYPYAGGIIEQVAVEAPAPQPEIQAPVVTVPEQNVQHVVEQAPVVPAAPVQAEVPAAPAAPVVSGYLGNSVILADSMDLRADMDYSSALLTTVKYGDIVRVEYDAGFGWYCVSCNGKTGFMSSVWLSYPSMNLQAESAPAETNKQEEKPAQTQTSVQKKEDTVVQAPVQAAPQQSAAATTGGSVVNTAMQYLGTPYVWGGTTPKGFDCSGFVQYVYKQLGVKTSRVAQAISTNGSAVSTSDLQAGDVLCFGSSASNIWHVGIYTGDGNFIHSAGSGNNVRVDNLKDICGMNLVSARRLV